MDMNNENGFFGNVKQDDFEDSSISGSGIAYENSPNKSPLNTVLIAVGVGALLAFGILLLYPKKDTNKQPNNLADIPTITSPSDTIKIVPEDTKLNEVFKTASVYKSDNIDSNPASQQNAAPAINVVKPEPIPTIKTEDINVAKPTVKPVPTTIKLVKPAPKAAAKTTKPQQKPNLVEKSTNVKGEVEITSKQPAKKEAGKWNVQITSTSSEAAANKEWVNLVGKYPEILKGLSHTVSKTEVGGKVYYRLRVSNIESSTKATEICNALKAKKVSCFITK